MEVSISAFLLATWQVDIPGKTKKFEDFLKVESDGIIFNRKRYNLTEINLQKIKPKDK